jgi:transcriptional regulator GlxA family with amidase domain
MPRSDLTLLASRLSLLTALALAVVPTVAAQHRQGMAAHGPRTIGVLLYEGSLPIDFVIAADMFRSTPVQPHTTTSDHTAHGPAFTIFTVGKSRAPVSVHITGALTPDYAMEQSPIPDVLIVPGGHSRDILEDSAAVAWLRGLAAQGTIFYSVCTGAYVLAGAGLLDGREATTIRAHLDLLRRLAPAATVVDQPFVMSENVVTTQGAATAVEATLAIITRLLGQPQADWLATEYLNYRRP